MGVKNNQRARAVFFLTLLGLSMSIGLCAGSPPEKDERCEYLSKLLGIVRGHVRQVVSCVRTGIPGLIQTHSHLCVAKCILTEFGILNRNGTIDITGIDKFVETSIPPSFRAMSLDLVLDCQEDSEKIDPSDETCKSYEPMLDCTTKGLRTAVESAVNKLRNGQLDSTQQDRLRGALQRIPCLLTIHHLEREIQKLERWNHH